MIRIIFLFLMMAVTAVTSDSFADTEYYKHVGTGSYGVSVRKINCPNCGKLIDANESHMCRKESSSTSGSSRYSDDSYEGAVDVGAKYPELLINQTSYSPTVPVASSSEGESYDNSGDIYGNKASETLHTLNTSSKKKSSSGIYVVIVIAVVVWFLYRRFRKKRRMSGLANTLNSSFSDRTQATSHTHTTVDAQAHTPSNMWNEAGLSTQSPQMPDTKEYVVTPQPKQTPDQPSSGGILDKISGIKTKASEIIETAKKSEQAQKMQKSINSGIRLAKEKTQAMMDNVGSKSKPVSVVDELKKLNELHKDGALTDEEYDRLKKRLIQ